MTNAAGFSVFCVEKTAAELVRGNLVALTTGAWVAIKPPGDLFSLEAVFIVQDVAINCVLLDVRLIFSTICSRVLGLP